MSPRNSKLIKKDPFERSQNRWGGSLLLFALLSPLAITSGCLEKQPNSEIASGGAFGGVGGKNNVLGSTKIGNVTGSAAVGAPAKMEHNAAAHEDKAPGFDAEPAEHDGKMALKPTGSETLGEGGDAPTHLDMKHEDKPGGADSDSDAAAHEERTHVDRPGGYGGYGGDGEVELAAAGAPGGENSGGLPLIASPFEKEYAGQEMVLVSGTIEGPDGIKGIGDLDCFVPDSKSPARRRYVNKIKVRIPGEYKMKVPKDFGELILSAFLDVNQDGPDGADPQGNYEGEPLVIKDIDISGVDITLGAKPPPPMTQ